MLGEINKNTYFKHTFDKTKSSEDQKTLYMTFF